MHVLLAKLGVAYGSSVSGITRRSRAPGLHRNPCLAAPSRTRGFGGRGRRRRRKRRRRRRRRRAKGGTGGESRNRGNTCAVGGGRAAFLERLTKRRVATYYTCSTSHTLECGTRGAPVATSSSAAMGGRQLRVPLLATSSAAMGGRQFFNDARASTGLLASLETML